MNKQLFNFAFVPPTWALCFNDSCPIKKTCMRYFVGKNLPADQTNGPSVYPNALQKESCRHFVEKRIIRAAWGFSQLFLNVKRVDDTPLRNEIKQYLGGHGTYYRYMHGECTLSPQQQQWILNLFRRYGYTENLAFDNYTDRYAFEEVNTSV